MSTGRAGAVLDQDLTVTTYSEPIYSSENLTAKVEGLYVNLEQDDDDVPVVAGQDKTEFGVIRAGPNYKFTSY